MSGSVRPWRQARNGDVALLNARETKPPGEKMIAFFRLCAVAFAKAAFCVKTDDDTSAMLCYRYVVCRATPMRCYCSVKMLAMHRLKSE